MSVRNWAVLVPLCLALAGCSSMGPGPSQVEAPPPRADAPPPQNIQPQDLVGRWGLAAYHKEGDRKRTETAARAQCGNAYTIARGPNGGVVMHLADATQPQELELKAGEGRNYIGLPGPAADAQDREILSFDGRILVLRWVDPEVAGRYGTMVYVRCTPRA